MGKIAPNAGADSSVIAGDFAHPTPLRHFIRTGGMRSMFFVISKILGFFVPPSDFMAAREWVGLLAYWLTGRSSELFPGPATRS